MGISIGMTEGNDPAFCPSWFDRAINCNGVIAITKNLNDQVRSNLLRLFDLLQGRVMVHCTCTGFGGTILEPYVPTPEQQTNNLQRLIEDGFPTENVVFRIDPIVPTERGLNRFKIAFSNLNRLNERLTNEGKMPVNRVRVSIIDNYRHVADRFEEAGLAPLYNGEFRASRQNWKQAKDAISEALSTATVPVSLELCAEDGFSDFLGDDVPHATNGCLSEQDLFIMGFSQSEIENAMTNGQNGQHREGCHCLTCKRELIPAKGRCGHQCLYCYWRDRQTEELEGQLHF